jgi:hypothetical protein
MMKIWNKSTGPDFKQKEYPELVFLLKIQDHCVNDFFFLKVNNMKY